MFSEVNKEYQIKVQVLEGGKLPSKAHINDAGFDVYATSDISVAPGEIVKHPLNIKLELPVGSWARVETKSGLGSKGMLVYAGVIDEGYRGVVHAILTNLNHKDGPIEIKKGQKLAQMTMNNHSSHYWVEQVEKVDSDTSRAAGGFGSSGSF
jgi:dUTP pyrophosphatase